MQIYVARPEESRIEPHPPPAEICSSLYATIQVVKGHSIKLVTREAAHQRAGRIIQIKYYTYYDIDSSK